MRLLPLSLHCNVKLMNFDPKEACATIQGFRLGTQRLKSASKQQVVALASVEPALQVPKDMRKCEAGNTVVESLPAGLSDQCSRLQ